VTLNASSAEENDDASSSSGAGQGPMPQAAGRSPTKARGLANNRGGSNSTTGASSQRYAGALQSSGSSTSSSAEEEFFVESILDSRVDSRSPGKFKYLIKWQGYGHGDNSWEPEENLSAPEKLAEFKRKHGAKQSSYVGVHWHDKSGKWEARCDKNGKTYEVGLYDTEKQARDARLAFRKEGAASSRRDGARQARKKPAGTTKKPSASASTAPKRQRSSAVNHVVHTLATTDDSSSDSSDDERHALPRSLTARPKTAAAGKRRRVVPSQGARPGGQRPQPQPQPQPHKACKPAAQAKRKRAPALTAQNPRPKCIQKAPAGAADRAVGKTASKAQRPKSKPKKPASRLRASLSVRKPPTDEDLTKLGRAAPPSLSEQDRQAIAKHQPPQAKKPKRARLSVLKRPTITAASKTKKKAAVLTPNARAPKKASRAKPALRTSLSYRVSWDTAGSGAIQNNLRALEVVCKASGMAHGPAANKLASDLHQNKVARVLLRLFWALENQSIHVIEEHDVLFNELSFVSPTAAGPHSPPAAAAGRKSNLTLLQFVHHCTYSKHARLKHAATLFWNLLSDRVENPSSCAGDAAAHQKSLRVFSAHGHGHVN